MKKLLLAAIAYSTTQHFHHSIVPLQSGCFIWVPGLDSRTKPTHSHIQGGSKK